VAFGRNKDSGPEPEKPLAIYDVVYKGGLRELPKSKVAKIVLELWPDHFVFVPTNSSKKFWIQLEIPYSSITSVDVTDRTVSTFEGLAGGLDSKQLNQKNNIHFGYRGAEGDTLLRVEMLSGVTVMGQAKKCLEFEDRLRTFRIRDQFVTAVQPSASPALTSAAGGSLTDELKKLAVLHDAGALTDDEFAAAKARLLQG